MHGGFSCQEFWIMEKRKTVQIPAFGWFDREKRNGQASLSAEAERGGDGRDRGTGRQDCAVRAPYATCIIYLRTWNSTMLHLIFWGNNWTSSSQHSYWSYMEMLFTVVFTVSSPLEQLVKNLTILLTLMCLSFHSWCLVTGKGWRSSPSLPVQRSWGAKWQFVVWLSGRESLPLRLILQTNSLKL